MEEGSGAKAKKANFAQVITLSREALATKSKDLWLAVWLCDALVHEEQIKGLRQGLEFVFKLLDGFWDSIYPKLDGSDPWPRFAPLDWLGQYCNAAKGSSPTLALRFLSVSGIAATSSDRKQLYREMAADIQASLESLAALDGFCQARFSEEPPGFSILGREIEALGVTVQSLLDTELKSNPDIVATPSTPAPALPGTPLLPDLQASAVLNESPLAGEIKTAAEAIEHITAAVSFLQRTAPSSAVPYLVIRALRWGELRDAGEDRFTDLLDAPPPDLRKNMRRYAHRGDWAALLETTETSMRTTWGRAWLDLQRYAILACEHLGYTVSAKALRSELKHLLSDLPELTASTLVDDTGAANPDTLVWLRKEGLTN